MQKETVERGENMKCKYIIPLVACSTIATTYALQRSDSGQFRQNDNSVGQLQSLSANANTWHSKPYLPATIEYEINGINEMVAKSAVGIKQVNIFMLHGNAPIQVSFQQHYLSQGTNDKKDVLYCRTPVIDLLPAFGNYNSWADFLRYATTLKDTSGNTMYEPIKDKFMTGRMWFSLSGISLVDNYGAYVFLSAQQIASKKLYWEISHGGAKILNWNKANE